MNPESILNSGLFTWIILPFLIFLARVVDVTIGTIRIIFLNRGSRYMAPVLGFFEVFIWLLAIRQVLANLSNIFCYIGYAAGFAMGNYIGMLIDNKLAIGRLILRIIIQTDPEKLLNSFKRKSIGVTEVAARGSRGQVRIIYTVINRIDLDRALSSIHKYNPNAFYTIESVLTAKEGIFPAQPSLMKKLFPRRPKIYWRFRLYPRLWGKRKGK
jgi:uncharacterized protein YebE (UPF0316 family)